jgi:hypothetical protein
MQYAFVVEFIRVTQKLGKRIMLAIIFLRKRIDFFFLSAMFTFSCAITKARALILS